MANAMTVERSVQRIIDGEDALISAVVAAHKYPMDIGIRAQLEGCKAELKEAWINHLLVCGLIE